MDNSEDVCVFTNRADTTWVIYTLKSTYYLIKICSIHCFGTCKGRCVTVHDIKTYVGVEIWLGIFLDSMLEGGEGSASRHGVGAPSTH